MLVLTDKLPSDSVLRRHTLAERSRVLGLPPTDAVLRRHFEQLQAAVQGALTPAPAQAVAKAAAVARTATVAVAPVATARLAPAAQAPAAAAPAKEAGGGVFAWVRRLIGL